ncbi:MULTISPECIES: ORF6N domain-containing protein [Providencia]|uniref:ORF6N domain-containing protein n=2 Tax=Morganellaceae TaxID=1903414 RepID=UPI00234974C9|nr:MULTISPECIES: ORF6N domain-containing protein [unclassified Providencia]ELR5140199.1 ORF6N domain-containing protein [Providencia rettgeri]
MANVSNVSNISNSIKTMPVITHNGVPVVTTETIASLYDTVVGNIKTNFSRNAKRFIEGKHYFKLTGSVLKDFKNKVTKSNLVACAKNAKHLTLWTERGAARHAKMLDTDNAWDVFEALEDFYFAKKECAFHKTTTDDRAPLRNAVDCLMTKKRLSFPKAYGYVHAKYGVNSIDEVPLDLLPEAVDYIYKVALEGEYIPKQMPLPELSFNKQLSIKTLEGAMTHIRTIREYWNSGLQESLKQLGYPHTGSLTEHMIEPLFKIEWVIREIKGNETAKLLA